MSLLKEGEDTFDFTLIEQTDGLPYHIKVIDTTYRDNHTYYNLDIHCERTGNTHQIQRRFSHFVKLDEWIRIRHPQLYELMVPLPSESFFTRLMGTEKQKAEIRLGGLDDYLAQIIKSPDLVSAYEVRQFFELYDSASDVQGIKKSVEDGCSQGVCPAESGKEMRRDVRMIGSGTGEVWIKLMNGRMVSSEGSKMNTYISVDVATPLFGHQPEIPDGGHKCTKTVPGDSPVWNEEFLVAIEKREQPLVLNLWHQASLTSILLGYFQLDLTEVPENQVVDYEIPLEGNMVKCTLYISLKYIPLPLLVLQKNFLQKFKKLSSFRIELPEGNTFGPGDVLPGVVCLNVGKPISLESLVVTFSGSQIVIIQYGSHDDVRTKQFFKERIVVLSQEQAQKYSENGRILPGTYRFPFEYVVPQNFPATLKTSKLTVLYYVQAKIKKARLLQFNPTATEKIDIKSNFDSQFTSILFNDDQNVRFRSEDKRVQIQAVLHSPICYRGREQCLSFTIKNDSEYNIEKISISLVTKETHTVDRIKSYNSPKPSMKLYLSKDLFPITPGSELTQEIHFIIPPEAIPTVPENYGPFAVIDNFICISATIDGILAGAVKFDIPTCVSDTPRHLIEKSTYYSYPMQFGSEENSLSLEPEYIPN